MSSGPPSVYYTWWITNGVRRKKCPELCIKSTEPLQGVGFHAFSWLWIAPAGCCLQASPPAYSMLHSSQAMDIQSAVWPFPLKGLTSTSLCCSSAANPLPSFVSRSPRSVIPPTPTRHQTLLILEGIMRLSWNREQLQSPRPLSLTCWFLLCIHSEQFVFYLSFTSGDPCCPRARFLVMRSIPSPRSGSHPNVSPHTTTASRWALDYTAVLRVLFNPLAIQGKGLSFYLMNYIRLVLIITFPCPSITVSIKPRPSSLVYRALHSPHPASAPVPLVSPSHGSIELQPHGLLSLIARCWKTFSHPREFKHRLLHVRIFIS